VIISKPKYMKLHFRSPLVLFDWWIIRYLQKTDRHGFICDSSHQRLVWLNTAVELSTCQSRVKPVIRIDKAEWRVLNAPVILLEKRFKPSAVALMVQHRR